MDSPHPRTRTTHITVELSRDDVRALKRRTGKKTANAALKAWVANADTRYTHTQLKSALAKSLAEESKGKGRRFKSGREAIRWLES
jgi:hypothetical protein